ncbi:MAG: UDP-N-acetylmuramoyl-tripeptide--D-alanyl-D-alanine ligase [Lachnospiraceae bacterium]|nr:UDP-N-acetylmuramoyl-tripeptide--D-alanyl-D-alanine ligase [Lachnospiraceae bacterium]
MKHFTLKQFAEACHAQFFGPEEILAQEVRGVVQDNRLIEPGFLFVAVRGERVDGHRFIPDVYEKGALCALSQQKLEHPAGPYLLVEDTLQALKEAAEAYRRTLTIPIIGVTGSVGKTSTKEMIASILSQKYCVLKTPGNLNNEIGLPLTIFQIDECHEAAVLEMGMNHFGEMHRLSRIARPTCCVLTNISTAHLEYLGSRDGIFRAKCEIFDYASPDAAVFVNGDDDKLIALAERATTFGLGEENCVRADQIEKRGLGGVRCRILTNESAFRVTIPLPGVHMVYNALAGICVGLSLGLNTDEIRRGIEALRPLPGRSNILHTPRYTLLDDCYNANPASMIEALNILEDTRSRKVAILGDMGELGPQSPELHASVGRHIGTLHIDLLLTIGENSAKLHEAAVTAAPQTHCIHFSDLESFLEEKDSLLKDGDAVLIKASHAMRFERIVEALCS